MPRVGIRDLPKGTINHLPKKIVWMFYRILNFLVQSAIICVTRTVSELGHMKFGNKMHIRLNLKFLRLPV